jgi:N-acetylmuramoyl-L-alanine amidase
VIAVDAGHYPEAPGAIAASGKPEHEFNLALAEAVADELRRRGFGVRRIAHHPVLAERTREAQGAALFISIHHDSVKQPFLDDAGWFSGFSLFVSRLNPALEKSTACASAIGRQLRASGLSPSRYHADEVFGYPRPYADPVNGVHYYDNLAVARTAAMPSVLVEAGVIVNSQEERELDDPVHRRRIAAAIARGVGDCLP